MMEMGIRTYSVARVISAQKLPTVFTEWRAKPRTSAMRDRHARRCGKEIVHRQPGHLDEVAQGALSGIVLPVGVGKEAPGSVEGKVRGCRSKVLRIPGQDLLHPQEEVKEQPADQAERKERRRICQPRLLHVLIDQAKPVDEAFDRTKRLRKKIGTPLHHRRHIRSQRLDASENQQEKNGNLQPPL